MHNWDDLPSLVWYSHAVACAKEIKYLGQSKFLSGGGRAAAMLWMEEGCVLLVLSYWVLIHWLLFPTSTSLVSFTQFGTVLIFTGNLRGLSKQSFVSLSAFQIVPFISFIFLVLNSKEEVQLFKRPDLEPGPCRSNTRKDTC